MPGKRSADEEMERLRGLGEAPLNAEGEKLLREALRGRNRELAAAAANIACQEGLESYCGDMAKAFFYFLANPKKDQGCIAKCALAEALDELHHEDDDLFLEGLKHTQPEPVWGGREDTAAPLRARCAFALARRNLPGVLFRLADLLSDPEPEARAAAIRAIAYTAGEQAELMLRVLAGQVPNATDLAECLAGLMECNPERSLPFVARFLNHQDPQVVEGAALALGSSRQPEAFMALKRQWEQMLGSDTRDRLLLPIALIRSEQTLGFLLEILKEGHPNAAEAALEALAILRDDPATREAVEAAVSERDQPPLTSICARIFGEA